MHIICTASVKFRGLAWYAYDIEFRKRAAKKQLGTTRHATVPWQIHMQAWLGVHVLRAVQPTILLKTVPFLSRSTVPDKTSATISTKVLSIPANLVPSSTAVTEKTVANSTPATTTTTNILQSRLVTVTNSHLSSLSPKTPINVDLLESYLLNHPDRSFVSFLCDGLRYGFKISYMRVPPLCFELQPYKRQPKSSNNRI